MYPMSFWCMHTHEYLRYSLLLLDGQQYLVPLPLPRPAGRWHTDTQALILAPGCAAHSLHHLVRLLFYAPAPTTASHPFSFTLSSPTSSSLRFYLSAEFRIRRLFDNFRHEHRCCS